MKIKRIICVAGLIGVGAMGTAFADNVTFDAAGTYADGSSLGGTITIDTDKGLIQTSDLDLTVTGGTSSVDYTFDDLLSTNDYELDTSDNFYQINVLESSDSGLNGPILTLMIPIGSNTTLTGFTGSSTLCSFSGGNCSGGNYYSDWEINRGDPFLTAGSLSPASAPEPASLLLLVGPAALLFRRQRRKA